MSEILTSIKLIKFYAWEKAFASKVAGKIHLPSSLFTQWVFYEDIVNSLYITCQFDEKNVKKKFSKAK